MMTAQHQQQQQHASSSSSDGDGHTGSGSSSSPAAMTEGATTSRQGRGRSAAAGAESDSSGSSSGSGSGARSASDLDRRRRRGAARPASSSNSSLRGGGGAVTLALPLLLLLLLLQPSLVTPFLVPSSSPAPAAAGPTKYGQRAFAPPAPLEAMTLRVTSANILAPIYKRLDNNGTRESHFEDQYLARHRKVVDALAPPAAGRRPATTALPDIICVQEFWVRGEKFKAQYLDRFCTQLGYKFVEVERTNNRGDGVACFVSPRVELVDSRPILFLDCGDRVGVLCRLRIPDDEGEDESCEVLVVNTHLLFPHNPYSSRIRLREVQKVLGFIDKYKYDEDLGPLPIVFCGDLNGSPRGQVAQYLRQKGFVSAFEAYNRPRAPHKVERWISHFSHRQEYVGVDFIWHLQPQNQSRPLAADWRKLVFSEIQKELPAAVRAAFRVFDSDDNSFIDPAEFKRTLQSLGFTGEGRPALTDEEIEFLFSTTDRDSNGMIDFKEFVDRFWEGDLFVKGTGEAYVPYLPDKDAPPEGAIESAASRFDPYPRREEEEFFFRGQSTSLENVKTMKITDCFITPREMEEGRWPDSYDISDHGFLTAQYTLRG